MIYLDEEICDPCGTITIFEEDPETGYKWCHKCKEWYFCMRICVGTEINQPLQLELF